MAPTLAMASSRQATSASVVASCLPVCRVPAAVFKSITSSCSTSGRLALASVKTSRAGVVTFAKGKGGKGGAAAAEKPAKGGKGGKGGSDSDDVDSARLAKEAKTDAEERMKKALTVMGDNFNTIRTGRANPAILDRIMVDYYGSPTPLKNVCTISIPDSSTLVLTPFEKSGLKDIERAINESDLGLNPSNDGERIRLGLPQLTQDRRKELVKQVSKMGEETKVAVRNVRKDVMKKIDKAGDAFPKDAKKQLEDEIQKVTDNYCKKSDDMVKAKSDELMKI